MNSKVGGKTIGLQGLATINQNDLVVLKELLGAGTVVPVIDRTYPLNETAEAIRYLEAGHARGKVIVIVEQDTKI
jgi:NADPH:quinone reductase-like Zn-dependent oxidoreductase